ncbi:MAG TPA: HyaD/HybD family hydrogenase maturation endopeptidase [Candidatus Sulfotelmatobacter sp.]|jgi:hydrogenase maturation protease|nr:HyaD/HybD family hydrogenase maturation endopeptidase [Candidatus Sulfotelmatobacter sp.]
MRVVVLGIGNTLMTDEGFGVHAIEALEKRYDMAEGVEIVDGGTTGMELFGDLQGVEHLLVVDAVRAGQPEGGIVRLTGDDVPAFFKTKLSPHQIGLSDVLAALRFAGSEPESVVLIGVKPVSLDISMEMTPQVAACVDPVIGMVVEELKVLGVPPRPKA